MRNYFIRVGSILKKVYNEQPGYCFALSTVYLLSNSFAFLTTYTLLFQNYFIYPYLDVLVSCLRVLGAARVLGIHGICGSWPR